VEFKQGEHIILTSLSRVSRVDVQDIKLVLRVMTDENRSFLLKTKDIIEMNTWIDAIRKATKVK
jgi:hypothetical protein